MNSQRTFKTWLAGSSVAALLFVGIAAAMPTQVVVSASPAKFRIATSIGLAGSLSQDPGPCQQLNGVDL